MLKVGDRVWSFSLGRYGVVKRNLNNDFDSFTDYPILVEFENNEALVPNLEQLYTEEGKSNKFHKNPDLFKYEIKIPDECKLSDVIFVKINKYAIKNVKDKKSQNFYNKLLKSIDDVIITFETDYVNKDNKYCFVAIEKDGFRRISYGVFLIEKDKILDIVKDMNNIIRDNATKNKIIDAVTKYNIDYLLYEELPDGGGGINGYVKYLNKLYKGDIDEI